MKKVKPKKDIVYALFKSGPEWSTLLGLYRDKAKAEALAKAYTDAVAELGNKAPILDTLSTWHVEEREIEG